MKPGQLDKQVCKHNLLVLKKIFDKNNIQFRLGYGTLLGAIREQDFISHDTDVDLVLDKKDKPKVEALIKTFKRHGFKVCRNFENVLSIGRKKNNVDFYFFSERNFVDKFLGRVTCGRGIWCLCIDNVYFDFSEERDFLREKFLVFKNPENWLIQTYGESWTVPQIKKGKTRTFSSRVLCRSYTWLKPRVPWIVRKWFVLKYRSLVK